MKVGRVQSMDTFDKQLRYFVKIADVKSLSRAAADLDCTQPGLSRQLAALEAHLGCTLFTRTGRGMDLTDCGHRLLESIRPAFAAVDATLRIFRNRHEARGLLTLATVHTLTHYFIGDLVRAFNSRYGGVNLSVMGRSSPDVVSLVETGKADVGYVYDTAVASDKLISTPLFEDRMCLIAAPSCLVEDGADLTRAMPKLVGFPQHYVLRRMMHSSGLHPHFVAEADTLDAMLEMVSSGIGACILPERMPERLLQPYGLRKIPIGLPRLSRRVVAVVRSDRSEAPLVSHHLATAHEIARAMGMP